jgi:hypothetical protein
MKEHFLTALQKLIEYCSCIVCSTDGKETVEIQQGIMSFVFPPVTLFFLFFIPFIFLSPPLLSPLKQ